MNLFSERIALTSPLPLLLIFFSRIWYTILPLIELIMKKLMSEELLALEAETANMLVSKNLYISAPSSPLTVGKMCCSALAVESVFAYENTFSITRRSSVALLAELPDKVVVQIWVQARVFLLTRYPNIFPFCLSTWVKNKGWSP